MTKFDKGSLGSKGTILKEVVFGSIVGFTQVLILELSNCGMVQSDMGVMLLDSLQ
jgi:hypothetical protein